MKFNENDIEKFVNTVSINDVNEYNEIDSLDIDLSIIRKIQDVLNVIKSKYDEEYSLDSLVNLLISYIYKGDMEVWLTTCFLEGKSVSLSDAFVRFFELYSLEDIINIYCIESMLDNKNLKVSKLVLSKSLCK